MRAQRPKGCVVDGLRIPAAQAPVARGSRKLRERLDQQIEQKVDRLLLLRRELVGHPVLVRHERLRSLRRLLVGRLRKHPFDPRAHASGRRRGLVHPVLQVSEQLPATVVEQDEKQLVLRAEVLVESLRRQPGALQDVAQRRIEAARLLDQTKGRVDEQPDLFHVARLPLRGRSLDRAARERLGKVLHTASRSVRRTLFSYFNIAALKATSGGRAWTC